MKDDTNRPKPDKDDLFAPTPGKQSDKPAEKERTIAKTKTTKRYGFHIIGKWYMIAMALLVLGLGYMLFTIPEYQPMFALLTIAYFVIVGLTLAGTPSREIILTDRRLLFKTNGTEGSSYDIAFDRILNIIPLTPVLGRVFNYGSVDILLDDQTNIETIFGVEDHEAFCEKARKALIEYANAKRDHERIVQHEKTRHAMAKNK